MAKERYRVIAVEMAEQHEGETVWRVRVRSVQHRVQPARVFYVSQPAGRAVPHDVGGTLELDERLLEREA